MDLYCQVCGEPFEAYYLQHDVTVEEREFFYEGHGCDYCKGKTPEGGRPEIALLSQAAFDIMGKDEIDGIASTMEDYI